MTSPPEPKARFKKTKINIQWLTLKQNCQNRFDLLSELTDRANNRKTICQQHHLIRQWTDFKYFHRNVPQGSLYQKMLKSPTLLRKIKIKLQRHLLVGQQPDLEITSQKCYLDDLLPKFIVLLHKPAARAKKIIPFQANSPISKYFHRNLYSMTLYQNC